MKLELIEEVPRVAGSRFRNKTLGTELRWDGVSPLPPTVFDTFRISYRTNVYRGPNGERWSYNELRENTVKLNGHFKGTGSHNEAVDFEFWYDWGSDGHVEWEYQGTWRFFMHPENEAESSMWLWLGDTSGDDIQNLLAEYLYEINRDKWEKKRAE